MPYKQKVGGSIPPAPTSLQAVQIWVTESLSSKTEARLSVIILSRNYPTNSSPCCSINFTTSGGGGPSGGGGGLSVSPGSPTPRKNPSIPGGEKMKRTRASSPPCTVNSSGTSLGMQT